MTSLAAAFFNLPERGFVRTGFYADLLVLDFDRLRDVATYEDPHHFSEGIVHALVNGGIAVRDGKATGTMAGRPLSRASARR